MNLKDFNEIEPGAVFASGTLPNSSDGLFMTDGGGELRWIAKKGYGNDWAIYCHWSFHSEEWIEQQGDKVTFETHIQKCVPCDEEVYKLYRF